MSSRVRMEIGKTELYFNILLSLTPVELSEVGSPRAVVPRPQITCLLVSRIHRNLNTIWKSRNEHDHIRTLATLKIIRWTLVPGARINRIENLLNRNMTSRVRMELKRLNFISNYVAIDACELSEVGSRVAVVRRSQITCLLLWCRRIHRNVNKIWKSRNMIILSGIPAILKIIRWTLAPAQSRGSNKYNVLLDRNRSSRVRMKIENTELYLKLYYHWRLWSCPKLVPA